MKNSYSSKRLSNIKLFKDLVQHKNTTESLLTEIKQMNKELKSKHFLSDSKFNSKEFINNALKRGLCITEKNNIKNYKRNEIREIIKELKENAKIKYITNKSEKNKKSLNEEFEEILDKYNEKTRIKLNKYFDDLIQIKNEQMKIIIENQTLESQIDDANIEDQALKKRLYEKNIELNKIIKKLDIYEKVKPFFELIRKFPEEDSKQIMSLFFNNKNKLIDLLHKIDNYNVKYEDIINSRNKEQSKELKFKENIIEKINEKKNFFDNKNKIIELDILTHEKEYEMIQKIKKDGMKHKKLLLFIYNLIKKFIPEKNYNIFIKQMKFNPIYSEENFDYNIFSNQAYINLIKNNIINKGSKCKEGILLRNTIAIGNYISRKYLNSNKKEKYRYNPIKIYKEFKIYFDKINIKNFSLKRKFNYLKQKLDELEKENNIIEDRLNKWKLKYNELYNNSEISLILQKNNRNKKDNKINEKYELNHLIKRKNSKRFTEENKITIDDNNIEKISKTIHNNVDKFFITDINNLNKRKESRYKKCFSNENFEKKRNKLDNNTTTNQKIYKKFLKNNNIYSSKYIINLKEYQLCLSKNKDKLFKKNGVRGNSDLYPYINELINQLNNEDIFIKFKNSNNKNNLSIETNDFYPLKKSLSNPNNIKKKNEKELTLRTFSSELNNHKKMPLQVLNNIDKMINSIKI